MIRRTEAIRDPGSYLFSVACAFSLTCVALGAEEVNSRPVGAPGKLDAEVGVGIVGPPHIYDGEELPVKIVLANVSGRVLTLPDFFRCGAPQWLSLFVVEPDAAGGPARRRRADLALPPPRPIEEVRIEGHVCQLPSEGGTREWIALAPGESQVYACVPPGAPRLPGGLVDDSPATLDAVLRLRIGDALQAQELSFTVRRLPPIEGLLRVSTGHEASAHCVYWVPDDCAERWILFYSSAGGIDLEPDAEVKADLSRQGRARLRLTSALVPGSAQINAGVDLTAIVQFSEVASDGKETMRTVTVRPQPGVGVPWVVDQE